MNNKGDFRNVFKLDLVTSTLKIAIIPSCIIAIFNILFSKVKVVSALIVITALCSVYLFRIYYIYQKFKYYRIVNARIIKRKCLPSTNSLVKFTYQYDFDNNKYTTSSRVSNFVGKANAIIEGDLIKIMIKVDNPQKSKIISLK